MSFQAIFGRLYRYGRQNGIGSMLRFLVTRVFRRERYVVFEARLDTDWPAPSWDPGYELLLIGPDNLDSEIGADAVGFLGGDGAKENLDGVRAGDRLFLVRNGREYHHCGYILFRTPQTAILGEPGHPPLIASCLTAPAARGRGLYRRALMAELRYLKELGYRRAVIETHPTNIASRRGIEAAGFRFCRELNVWIFLNRAVFQTAKEPAGTKRRLFVVSKPQERVTLGAK